MSSFWKGFWVGVIVGTVFGRGLVIVGAFLIAYVLTRYGII